MGFFVTSSSATVEITQKKIPAFEAPRNTRQVGLINLVPVKHSGVVNANYRVLKGGCPRGGGNWGTLRIPREDWGTLGNIREY